MSSSQTNSNRPMSSHFFKVMMPGFRKTLSIPLAFCKYIIGEKSSEAIIRSRKGLWHVKISKCRDGQLYFEEGWSKFVEEHDLNVGEFIVFEHSGQLHFEATVYDYSSCEKEYPLDDDSGNKSNDEKRTMSRHVQDTSKKSVKLEKSDEFEDEKSTARHVQDTNKNRAKLGMSNGSKDEKEMARHVHDTSKNNTKLDKSDEFEDEKRMAHHAYNTSQKRAKLDKSKIEIDTLNTMYSHSSEIVYF